jgi:hypothetical protein
MGMISVMRIEYSIKKYLSLGICLYRLSLNVVQLEKTVQLLESEET